MSDATHRGYPIFDIIAYREEACGPRQWSDAEQKVSSTLALADRIA